MQTVIPLELGDHVASLDDVSNPVAILAPPDQLSKTHARDESLQPEDSSKESEDSNHAPTNEDLILRILSEARETLTELGCRLQRGNQFLTRLEAEIAECGEASEDTLEVQEDKKS